SKEVQFSSAGAELSGTMKGILDKIAEQLKTEKGSQIIVAGHTDRHQVTGGKYEDNWDLSAARARAVRKYLKEQGLENVAIAAYANTKPLDPAQTSAADEKNRRIEIFIQRKYNKPETKIE
ncbi:MAG: OmpA family protein, partial [Candidatus Poribacteria bacterium]|nr:OmpA family protein [Candidatus Poribacteria bacterium]